jgi:hypothetical protein
MKSDEQWNLIRSGHGSRIGSAGMGALRLTLLFGTAVIAFALLATPMLDTRTDKVVRSGVGGLDMMSTGSIGRGETYTIRRSVLQPSPKAVCIIRENGARSGAC